MNTVLARRTHRKAQVDRKRRQPLVAAVELGAVALVAADLGAAALVAVGVGTAVGVVVAAVAVATDDLNQHTIKMDPTAVLAVESVCFIVKPCYLPEPFFTGNPTRCQRAMPPVKLST